MSKEEINFLNWIEMSEIERRNTHLSWNVYKNEGFHIVMQVLEKFKREYGEIKGLQIGNRVAIYHGGTWAIHVEHPFVFDFRKIPKIYFGIEVRRSVLKLPHEFEIKDSQREYVWAPERYEIFVDRCINEIRRDLAIQSRDEILDVLCPTGNFQQWKSQCNEWVKKGIIPAYT